MKSLLVLGAGVVLAASAFSPAAAQMTTIDVTTLNDTVAPDGLCSIREALRNAADQAATYADCPAGGPATEVHIPAGTIVLTGGEVGVGGSVRVIGAGMDDTVVDAGGASSAFRVSTTAAVTIEGMEIRRGAASEGAGVAHAKGDLTLERVRLHDNHATNAGGGVFTHADAGTLTVRASEVVGNSAVSFGGGIGSNGEGLPRTVRVEDSLVHGNSTGGAGGGIVARGGTLEIAGSTFTENSANYGAAVSTGLGTVLSMHDSSVRDNTAGKFGGGLLFGRGASATMTGVVIQDNEATDGGGVYVGTQETSVAIVIAESAIRNNAATGNGGGLFIASGAVEMERTSLGQNDAALGGATVWAWVEADQRVELTLTDVSVTTTSSPAAGAGIAFHAANGTGSLWIIESSFVGPSSVVYSSLGLFGGVQAKVINSTFSSSPGTAVRVSDPGTALTVTNSTFVGDSTGTIQADHLIHAIHDSSVVLQNTVLVQARDAACVEENGGTITGANNANDDGTCPGAIVVTGASLQPLTYADPYHRVHMPAVGSPLIDAGDATVCPATDAVGRSRANGCDIGAVEFVFRQFIPMVASDGTW